MTDEAPRYDASLEQYALVSVVKAVQMANLKLLSKQVPEALYELGLAWTLLPNSVRSHFPRSPWAEANARLDAIVPSLQEFHDTQVRKSDESWAEHATAKEREARLARAGLTVVEEMSLGFITELDKAGLYVRQGGGAMRATSNNVASEQPPLKKMPPTLARETIP